MKFRIAWLSIALLAAPSLAVAQDDFVVPSSNASTEGDSSNTIPFSSLGGNVRYQQVYLDEDIPPGPFTIYGIAFRPDALQSSFAFEIPEIDISLGPTAQGTALNAEFALNVGDPTLVASGPLSLASAAGGPTLSFDIEIWFDQPLAYDGGNLLLDVAIQSFTSNNIVLFDAVNLVSDPVSRVYSAAASGGSVTAPSGSVDTQGLVTKFLLPEPTGSAAAAFAALAALVRARTRRPIAS